MGRRRLPARTSSNPKSANIDPMLVQWLEMSHLAGATRIGIGLPTALLKALASTPHAGAIHVAQRNWGCDFASPQPTPYSIGYRVVKIDGSAYTPTDWRAIDEITEVIERAGADWWPGGFAGYVDAYLYNRLTYDWAPTEVIREEYGGKPWAFIPVDATTIRRAEPSEQELANYRWDSPDIAYVQVINDGTAVEIIDEFTREEMHVGVARALPAIERMGYGMPEIEQYAGLIAAITNAITANAMGIVSGVHMNQLIAIISKMGPADFQTTKSDLQTTLSGVRNNRRTAVMKLNPDNKDDIKVFPLGQSNESMQYMEWLDFLVDLLCRGHGMDTRTVFPKPDTKDVADYDKMSPTTRALQSKEQGFRPNLRKLSRSINESVVSWWRKYRLEFVGFDSQSERDKLEMNIKAVGHYMSPNELRASLNLSPFDDPVSNRPLNALYQSYTQQVITAGGALPTLEVSDDNMSAWVGGRRLPSPTQAA